MSPADDGSRGGLRRPLPPPLSRHRSRRTQPLSRLRRRHQPSLPPPVAASPPSGEPGRRRRRYPRTSYVRLPRRPWSTRTSAPTATATNTTRLVRGSRGTTPRPRQTYRWRTSSWCRTSRCETRSSRFRAEPRCRPQLQRSRRRRPSRGRVRGRGHARAAGGGGRVRARGDGGGRAVTTEEPVALALGERRGGPSCRRAAARSRERAGDMPQDRRRRHTDRRRAAASPQGAPARPRASAVGVGAQLAALTRRELFDNIFGSSFALRPGRRRVSPPDWLRRDAVARADDVDDVAASVPTSRRVVGWGTQATASPSIKASSDNIVLGELPLRPACAQITSESAAQPSTTTTSTPSSWRRVDGVGGHDSAAGGAPRASCL